MIINGFELKEYCFTLEEKYDANVNLILQTEGEGPIVNPDSSSKGTENTASGKVVTLPTSQINVASFYEILNVNMLEKQNAPKNRIIIEIKHASDQKSSLNLSERD